MAEVKDAATEAPKAAPAAPKPQNPVFKMMGLPNWRPKLPSRNWMIFWTIVASWSGAVYYDRREKKRIQKRWADSVAYLAREPLPPSLQQRKLTVFLAAPPMDGLLEAREHFHEYVRPILVSSGLDWDAIEGRREGDVRAAFAEWIRKRRKIAGEATTEPIDPIDLELMTDDIRSKMGVKDSPGPSGDIVIGRNTWKEYVRGLHEGWLGPVDTPADVKAAMEAAEKPVVEEKKDDAPAETAPQTEDAPPQDENVVFDSEVQQKSEDSAKKDEPPKPPSEEEKKPKKPKQPPPFITTTAYASASLASSTPPELGPSTVIIFPHLLGFLNTPIRIYRYLNKRKVADEVGREVAAAIFAHYRPYERSSESSGTSPFVEDSASPTASPHQEESAPQSGESWEQDALLKVAEQDWHKSVRKDRDPEKESVWVDDMVLDPRIAGRMRRFYLDEADVERGLALAKAFKEQQDTEKAEKKRNAEAAKKALAEAAEEY